MPIEQSRIEAAARALHAQYAREWGSDSWESEPQANRDAWLEEATEILIAAFPELASDPPTGWVAPWEATEAMQAAIWDCPPDEANRAWDAFRDAHLKEQGDE